MFNYGLRASPTALVYLMSYLKAENFCQNIDPTALVFCLASYLVFYFLPIAGKKRQQLPLAISRGPLPRALPAVCSCCMSCAAPGVAAPAIPGRRRAPSLPSSAAPAVLGRRRVPPLPSCRWPPLSTAPTVPGRCPAPPPPRSPGPPPSDAPTVPGGLD